MCTIVRKGWDYGANYNAEGSLEQLLGVVYSSVLYCIVLWRLATVQYSTVLWRTTCGWAWQPLVVKGIIFFKPANLSKSLIMITRKGKHQQFVSVDKQPAAEYYLLIQYFLKSFFALC